MVCIFSDGKGVIYIQKRRVEKVIGLKGFMVLKVYVFTVPLFVLYNHSMFTHFTQIRSFHTIKNLAINQFYSR